MKYFFVCSVLLILFSCKKDAISSSPSSLLIKYQWYSYEETDTLFNLKRDTALNVINNIIDSCTQKSYFQFKNDGTVTRYLPCYSPEKQGQGIWSLSNDSTLLVSIPFQGSNIGFISVNGPLKLLSINDNEMKTQYNNTVYIYQNGVSKQDIEAHTLIYKHH